MQTVRFARYAFVIAALASTTVLAQTLYRYTDERGKVYYSDKPLTHLTGRPVDQMTKQGTVVKRTPGALSPEERATLDAEAKRRAELDKQREAENRRNLALLATYSSEKEIDDAHAFALRDPMEILRETETKYAAADKRRGDLRAQIEKLAGKPVPGKLKQDSTDADLEAKSLSEILEAKRRDVQLINDRYDEDRRRYVDLQKQRAALLNGARGASPASSSAGR